MAQGFELSKEDRNLIAQALLQYAGEDQGRVEFLKHAMWNYRMFAFDDDDVRDLLLAAKNSPIIFRGRILELIGGDE